MTFTKLLPKFLIICSILAGLSLMTLINFKLNAVYYYQHSAVTDKDGIPFVVLDQLDWIIDGYFEENGAFTYNTENLHSISFKENLSSNSYSFIIGDTIPNSKYSFIEYVSNNQKKVIEFDDSYSISSSFYFSPSNNPTISSIKLSEADKDTVKQTLKTMTDPLLERVSAPIINLQWLYDGVYWIKERIEQ